MKDPFHLIVSRRSNAQSRLEKLRLEIGKFDSLRCHSDLCIYVTGSFGRLEASPHSDLDLFFVHKGKSTSSPMTWISKTLLDAELIQTTRVLGFPEFSNDGEYLTIHYLEDMKNALGGRDDDFRNFFTARLLLLLESRPLHNEDTYNDILGEIVNCYYRDYHDHEKLFRPVFLINDIIRFWRTLCLNYEHRRNRPKKDTGRQNKSHIDNLKLKFSRLLICHSTIALLSIYPKTVKPDDLLSTIALSPLERLDRIAQARSSSKKHVERMKELYAWFLEETGRDKEEVLTWISLPTNRMEAFDNGRLFADEMYKIHRKVTEETEIMRYLVV